MKQARGFGVGVLVATQNPMDLDYRALSNAGLWCLGRLQTDADRERVIDGLSDTDFGVDLNQTLRQLAPRWFVVRNAHACKVPILVQPRCTMTLMRGPMTRTEIHQAREWRASMENWKPAGEETRAESSKPYVEPRAETLPVADTPAASAPAATADQIQ
jgi:hypothetical protein